MQAYKCPMCGRAELQIDHADVGEPGLVTASLPATGVEVRCKHCGWFGTVEDLKAVY